MSCIARSTLGRREMTGKEHGNGWLWPSQDRPYITLHHIKRILDDASVLSVIDTARIGILARLNKLLYNIGLLSHSNTTSKNVTTKRPNIMGAKKQSIE